MVSASSLVVILTLGLLRGGSCSAAPSGGSGVPAPPLRPRGFLYATEDYDNFSDEPLAAATPPTHRPVLPGGGAARLCDYDVCREKQTPCAQLAAASGCFCPGVSSYNDPPEPPVLKSVSPSPQGGGAQATVRWCAPYSSVDSYLVTVGGRDRAEFGGERRSGALGDVERGARVCVVALNDKGRSAEVAESCTTYRPDGSSAGASSWLRAGLIGGALGFLVLLSLALLLWRHRTRRRKAQVTISSYLCCSGDTGPGGGEPRSPSPLISAALETPSQEEESPGHHLLLSSGFK